MTRIAFIGVGGVGGYFGGKLCLATENVLASDFEVCFVARGAHLRAIQSRGLILNAGEQRELLCRPAAAVEEVRELGSSVDIWFVCVKSYDLEAAARSIEPFVKSGTVVVPLLNGIDIYERIRTTVHTGIVLPACVYVGTHIEAPGVVTQKGGDGRILMGEDPQTRISPPEELTRILGASGIQYEVCEDISKRIWEKYAFIATFGILTAGFDRCIGDVLNSTNLAGLARRILAERQELAHREGVAVPDDLVDATFARARSFPPDSKTSFQRDVERDGRRTEMDLYGGTLMRLCRKWNFEAPALFSAIETLESRVC